ALMHNVAQESYFTFKLEEYENLFNENVETINSLDIDENTKASKIAEQQEILQARQKALSLGIAKAKQNIAGLYLGKIADPLEAEITTDKYGNEIVYAGLSNRDFAEYVDPDKMTEEELKVYNEENKSNP